MKRIIFAALVLALFAARSDAGHRLDPIDVLDKITLLEMRITKLEVQIRQLTKD